LLCLPWGAFFKDLSWAGIFLAGLATYLLTMTAKIEEAKNVRFFDMAYQAYMKQTKRFIPLIF
jgi:protein-S-isoprenylcysteine O-methyltransferase Ste14